LRRNASASTFAYPSEVTVDVHPGEMLQVISNLISNAVDAPAHRRHLYVRGRRSCRGVHILVADAGPGIPESIADKIFDPFFHDQAEQGYRLGLAVSKAIVEKHHGQIRARSSTRPGHSGTAFSHLAPLTQRSAAG